ncbi:DUF2721 domain-containing protein [Leptolyngbya sp. O-77]|uniref:DUF2721 domain-containing protein n=1 Tax=Leptolyngbya sp. O-77 TaxID=1080068 RepID=UPI00074D2BD1|nr:DUF2721 domain-containing protein [Leptolyngbya sp. O-77]BAU40969.1 hypothetical protein O77CONTIG1_00776 [Leptolyngbya sp. O-77]
MNAQQVAQTIQLIIAPVVLVTACALIQNAVLMRYSAIGQSMRSLALERLNLLRSKEDYFYMERLQEIDRQIPLLTQHHRLLQKTVIVIYSAVLVFLISMLAIALAVASNAAAIATLTLGLFLLGTGTLVLGVFLIIREVRLSHRAVCYEVGRISSLEKTSQI